MFWLGKNKTPSTNVQPYLNLSTICFFKLQQLITDSGQKKHSNRPKSSITGDPPPKSRSTRTPPIFVVKQASSSKNSHHHSMHLLLRSFLPRITTDVVFLMKFPKMVPFQGHVNFPGYTAYCIWFYKVEILQVSTQIRRCTNRCTVCPSDLTFVIPAYSMECVCVPLQKWFELLRKDSYIIWFASI